jgi:hypothetical protein
MDPIGKSRELDVVELCPDCNSLLTSDGQMRGDPKDLRINRRTWPIFDKGLACRCKLCSIIRREFNLQQDLIHERHLILGCRIENGDHLEKRTSLELMCVNELNRLGGEFHPHATAI